MMSTFPRGQRGRADVLAVTLRILLAVIFAVALSYCSTAIQQAKALFSSAPQINHHY